MAATPSTPFVMHGARDAIARGLAHVEQQVRSIEQAVGENPGLAFDLAKTLIESVCRTALGERNIAFSQNDDLPKLFKTASQSLTFLPAAASGEVEIRKSLAQTLSGLHTAIQGICALRNQCGFALHGAGVPRPPMESAQALLAAESADNIAGFLHRVHKLDRAPAPSPRALYNDNPDFNESVDDAQGTIRIYDVEFQPSEVLFQMEPETYRVYLAESDTETGDTEGGAAGGETVEATRCRSETLRIPLPITLLWVGCRARFGRSAMAPRSPPENPDGRSPTSHQLMGFTQNEAVLSLNL